MKMIRKMIGGYSGRPQTTCQKLKGQEDLIKSRCAVNKLKKINELPFRIQL